MLHFHTGLFLDIQKCLVVFALGDLFILAVVLNMDFLYGHELSTKDEVNVVIWVQYFGGVISALWR